MSISNAAILEYKCCCTLREKYWILGGRRSIRSIIATCTICKQHRVKRLEVVPAPLPIDRITDAKVFEICGTDFAEPLFLKNNEKAWNCIFTCAIYRVVHLELVTPLSTEAFLEEEEDLALFIQTLVQILSVQIVSSTN